jgi:uncharacterized protein YciI
MIAGLWAKRSDDTICLMEPEKKYFFIKLVAPRPTFAFDMNDAERKLMQNHVAYWQDIIAKGHVVIFGPVMDPKYPFGLAIVEVEDERQPKTFMEGDPTTRSGLGFTYEIYPVRPGMVRK